MGNKYSQLNIEDRVMITVLQAKGKSAREIGEEIGRSHSTIVRELNRNSPPVRNGYYLAYKADERAEQRKRSAGVRDRLKSARDRSYVESKLKSGWSPEQISGRLKLKTPCMYVSHEAIYQYIYAEAPDLTGYLARHHKKRHAKCHTRKHRKSHIPNRISIDRHPAHVDEREEFGHWEADSVVSSASKAALNVLAERNVLPNPSMANIIASRNRFSSLTLEAKTPGHL